MLYDVHCSNHAGAARAVTALYICTVASNSTTDGVNVPGLIEHSASGGLSLILMALLAKLMRIFPPDAILQAVY